MGRSFTLFAHVVHHIDVYVISSLGTLAPSVHSGPLMSIPSLFSSHWLFVHATLYSHSGSRGSLVLVNILFPIIIISRWIIRLVPRCYLTSFISDLSIVLHLSLTELNNHHAVALLKPLSRLPLPPSTRFVFAVVVLCENTARSTRWFVHAVAHTAANPDISLIAASRLGLR
jgi:hypothetical protein